jgi:hypothetical protein
MRTKEQDRLRKAEERATNPSACRERANRWRAKNIEKVRRQHREWVQAHPGYYAAWTAKNREKLRAKCEEWRKANLHKDSARSARQRLEDSRATPKWANRFFIEEIYDLAQKRTQATGFPWHVDHIIPLRSKKVCGLHVEHNLQVIPATHNIAKGNRHWPDMP